ARRRVLLERVLELRALLELERELRERAEAEEAQGAVQVRRAQHAFALRARPVASLLTRGAPVRAAGVGALPARADALAAARARTAGAVVDAAVVARAGDRAPHRPVRVGEHGVQLLVRHVREAEPGREPRRPERLGAPEVADARDE